MKLKKQNDKSGNKSVKTEVVHREGGTAEIWHTQDIKLSQNYQSASASYGVKLTVPDNDEAIRKAVARAEKLVETPLVAKVEEQRELLNSLGH